MPHPIGPSADAVLAAKRALRCEVAARVPKAYSTEHAKASAAAGVRLLQSETARSAGCIALYRSLGSEVATAELASALIAAGKDVCFPAVVEGEAVLHFRRPHGPSRPSALGIHEHEDLPGARVDLAAIDLFVVPARAVDRNGHRLGRGKGYYDATLAAAGARARRVCLVFDQQLVDRVPTEAHDARMDAICTDARWLDLPERPS